MIIAVKEREKAIAQLMIATMIVDLHRDKREFESISRVVEVLGVAQKDYDDLLNQSLNLSGFDEVILWSNDAITTLLKTSDPDICNVAIANMILVAKADGKFKDVENIFIQQTAKSLGVAIPMMED